MVSQILVDGVASAPPSNSWSKGRTDWNMLANNIVGDCTIAGFLHILMVAARILGLDYNPTDAEALALYTAITGYNPRAPLVNGENPTDQGATLEQVVAYLLQHPIDGFSFLGQALVNITDMNDVALAAYNFPGLYTGVNLPLISQNQEIWDVTPWDLSTNRNAQPGSWGEHCINLMDYDLDAKKVVFCTWGEPKVATFAWWKAYVEEARVLLPSDWLKSSLSPNGINEAALETYMQVYLNPAL
jgi:hypothetical protein